MLFWKIGISLIVFLLIKYLLSYIVLSSFFSATVEAKFDHSDAIVLYFASSDRTFRRGIVPAAVGIRRISGRKSRSISMMAWHGNIKRPFLQSSSATPSQANRHTSQPLVGETATSLREKTDPRRR